MFFTNPALLRQPPLRTIPEGDLRIENSGKNESFCSRIVQFGQTRLSLFKFLDFL